MTQEFAYHRAVAVTHLLVALWRSSVAMVLSALSLASVVWLVRFLLSFKRLPS